MPRDRGERFAGGVALGDPADVQRHPLLIERDHAPARIQVQLAIARRARRPRRARAPPAARAAVRASRHSRITGPCVTSNAPPDRFGDLLRRREHRE